MINSQFVRKQTVFILRTVRICSQKAWICIQTAWTFPKNSMDFPKNCPNCPKTAWLYFKQPGNILKHPGCVLKRHGCVRKQPEYDKSSLDLSWIPPPQKKLWICHRTAWIFPKIVCYDPETAWICT